MRYHFIGIGGSGMSSLAQILAARGYRVQGSDRSYDQGVNPRLFHKLALGGVSLVTQDGRSLEKGVGRIVVSNSVEGDNPDLIMARRVGDSILSRSELLAELTNASTSIACAGTSGKTTTCGMIGYALHRLGQDPTIINGGIINNLVSPCLIGNAINGRSNLTVFEADESDGSLVLYRPEIGVLTNIELDHKPLKELEGLFSTFLGNIKGTSILNTDCLRSRSLADGKGSIVTFGLKEGDVSPDEFSSTRKGVYFKLRGIPYRLNLMGLHNLSNALAAIAALGVLGLKDKEISRVLREFKGIRRRLECLGQVRGIAVFDDYGHNPDKIRAAILALKPHFKRLIIIFQPHGFSPTRFLKTDLIETFRLNLQDEDLLFMSEIYYAGGTTVKDISSRDLVIPLQEEGKRAYYYPRRDEIIDEVARLASRGDGVLVMGARDETLREFSLKIIKALRVIGN